MSTSASPAGSFLIWAQTTWKGSSWTEEHFLDDYKNNHMPRTLAIPGMRTGLRYRNADPNAEFAHLALYLPEDLKNLGHPEGQALYAEHASANIKSNVCFYESIQRFEGQLPKSGNHGKVMISVKMQPRDGGDEEFDEWYRKQHLDMLSMVKGYRRSTRWKVSELREAPEGTPMYIALHEYDDVPDPEEVKLAVGTEWSKKVIGEARSFVRDQWELIEVQGEDEKL